MTNNNKYFVGDYVDDYVDALIASALTKFHLIAVGESGNGKTAIAKSVAGKLFGDDVVFIRLSATCPPEKIEGMYDPAKAMGSPPEFVRIEDGTAYDPDAMAVVLDEVGRPNDAIHDILLDVLSPEDMDGTKAQRDNKPVVWGTSNFLPKSKRTMAFIDRVSLYCWLPDNTDNLKDVVSVQLASDGKPEAPGEFPTKKELKEVHNAQANVSEIEAISEFIDRIAVDIHASDDGSFKINNRRAKQWAFLLYKVSKYYNEKDKDNGAGSKVNGNGNFSIHKKALECLQWAYPTLSEKESRSWRGVINKLAQDPLVLAIDEILGNAFDLFREAKANSESTTDLAAKLGEPLGRFNETFRKLGRDFNDDPRIKDAQVELEQSYAKIVRGEDI